MLQRELSYEIPFERLTRLSRSAGRKAYPAVWWTTWLLLAMYCAAILAIFQYGHHVSIALENIGFPYGIELLFVGAFVLLVAGVLLLRRRQHSQVKQRANFGQTIRLSQDDGGVRFATPEIEHYLKWPGISQMLVERDGIVVSHGNLFFLVPDTAFATPAERLDFLRSVWDRLGEQARALSDKHVTPTLQAGGQQ